ncbi:hypothetical protein [Mesorhizobium sp. M1393]
MAGLNVGHDRIIVPNSDD